MMWCMCIWVLRPSGFESRVGQSFVMLEVFPFFSIWHRCFFSIFFPIELLSRIKEMFPALRSFFRMFTPNWIALHLPFFRQDFKLIQKIWVSYHFRNELFFRLLKINSAPSVRFFRTTPPNFRVESDKVDSNIRHLKILAIPDKLKNILLLVYRNG